MECFNLIYAHLSVQYHDIAHLSVRVYLVNIPKPVLYEIYTQNFSFDLRCESVTYNIIPNKNTQGVKKVRGQEEPAT